MRLREILHLLPIAGEYSPLCGRTVLLPALPGSLRLYISGLIFGGFAGKVHTLMVLTTDSRLFPRHPSYISRLTHRFLKTAISFKRLVKALPAAIGILAIIPAAIFVQLFFPASLGRSDAIHAGSHHQPASTTSPERQATGRPVFEDGSSSDLGILRSTSHPARRTMTRELRNIGRATWSAATPHARSRRLDL